MIDLKKLYSKPELLQKFIKETAEDGLISLGDEMAVKLFQDMSTRVPAYREFLKNNGFDPSGLRSISDFSNIPTTDKDNYLRANNRKDLCLDGDFKQNAWIISTTSGSTGEPFYFPRTSLQDADYATTAELYLRENFQIQDKSTLYIVAFPMGAWIGGVFTYEAITRVAEHGYRLSVITPGINKQEVIKAVQNLAKDFDQIIIGSYAPFLKDILDDGENAGIVWSDYKLGFIFSAEAFSEEFRDYVVNKAGLKNVYSDTLNHYGTVDMGTMAHETPLAILARRLALSNKEVYSELFNDASKLPTLCQYDPNLFYFEARDGNLICTSNAGFPLLRYDLKDRGGVIKKSALMELFQRHGIDLIDEAKKSGIDSTFWNWPFVYVYERSDFSVSYFAFQIYPETLKKALLVEELKDVITGKFSMLVRYDDHGQQIFEVNVELRPGKTDYSEELIGRISEILLKRLLSENSEYRKTSEELGIDRVRPLVVLWPYEDPTHFRPGGKQKWVKKV